MSTREYYSMQAATFSLLSVLCYYTTELLGGHLPTAEYFDVCIGFWKVVA